jgi:hypothetical protein
MTIYLIYFTTYINLREKTKRQSRKADPEKWVTFYTRQRTKTITSTTKTQKTKNKNKTKINIKNKTHKKNRTKNAT